MWGVLCSLMMFFAFIPFVYFFFFFTLLQLLDVKRSQPSDTFRTFFRFPDIHQSDLQRPLHLKLDICLKNISHFVEFFFPQTLPLTPTLGIPLFAPQSCFPSFFPSSWNVWICKIYNRVTCVTSEYWPRIFARDMYYQADETQAYALLS